MDELRRIKYSHPRKMGEIAVGWFHRWMDCPADGTAYALIEAEDGSMVAMPTDKVQFTDRG